MKNVSSKIRNKARVPTFAISIHHSTRSSRQNNQVRKRNESHPNQKGKSRDFPGGPVVKNTPSNARDVGPIPSHRTKIPHVTGQLSPWATTTEPTYFNQRACMPQLQSPRALEPARHNQRKKTCTPQPERSLRATTKSLRTTMEDPACRNKDPACCN